MKTKFLIIFIQIGISLTAQENDFTGFYYERSPFGILMESQSFQLFTDQSFTYSRWDDCTLHATKGTGRFEIISGRLELYFEKYSEQRSRLKTQQFELKPISKYTNLDSFFLKISFLDHSFYDTTGLSTIDIFLGYQLKDTLITQELTFNKEKEFHIIKLPAFPKISLLKIAHFGNYFNFNASMDIKSNMEIIIKRLSYNNRTDYMEEGERLTFYIQSPYTPSWRFINLENSTYFVKSEYK